MLLSRLSITKELDFNTPIDVIIDICDAHDITYQHEIQSSTKYNLHQIIEILISKIKNHKYISLDKITKNDFTTIATFVNPFVDWNIKDLTTAYEFLISFSNPHNFLSLNPSFEYGLQDPTNLKRLNSSVIFAACKYFNIKMTSTMPISECVSQLKHILENPKILSSSFKNLIENVSNDKMDIILKMYHHLKLEQ